MTIAFAKQVAVDAITVNAVAPEPIITRQTRRMYPAGAERQIPVKWTGTPGYVAKAIEFLAGAIRIHHQRDPRRKWEGGLLDGLRGHTKRRSLPVPLSPVSKPNGEEVVVDCQQSACQNLGIDNPSCSVTK